MSARKKVDSKGGGLQLFGRRWPKVNGLTATKGDDRKGRGRTQGMGLTERVEGCPLEKELTGSEGLDRKGRGFYIYSKGRF